MKFFASREQSQARILRPVRLFRLGPYCRFSPR